MRRMLPAQFANDAYENSYRAETVSAKLAGDANENAHRTEMVSANAQVVLAKIPIVRKRCWHSSLTIPAEVAHPDEYWPRSSMRERI